MYVAATPPEPPVAIDSRPSPPGGAFSEHDPSASAHSIATSAVLPMRAGSRTGPGLHVARLGAFVLSVAVGGVANRVIGVDERSERAADRGHRGREPAELDVVDDADAVVHGVREQARGDQR